MTIFTGKVIAGCKIFEKVGEGKVTTVYHAKHQLLRQDVAFKVIKDSYLKKDPKFFNRLSKQAASLKDLYHINVLHFIDSGEYEGSKYLITEYVDGPSLLRILKLKKRLSPKIAIPLAVQALQGLEYAHDKGFIHEDLKMTNMMLTRKGVLKISDFGLSEPVEFSEKHEGEPEILGTPNYMSPEHWRGKKLDVRTDIFSLGTIIYQLLSGIPPFWAKTPEEIREKATKASYYPLKELLNNFPPELDKIIKKMLMVRQAERYQNVQILADVLRKFQTEYLTKNKIEAKTVLIKLGEVRDSEEPSIKEIVDEVLDVEEIADEDYEAQIQLSVPTIEIPEFCEEKHIIAKEEEEIEAKLNIEYIKPDKPVINSVFVEDAEPCKEILVAACIENYHPDLEVFADSDIFAEEIKLKPHDFIPEPVFLKIPDDFKSTLEKQSENCVIFYSLGKVQPNVASGSYDCVFNAKFENEDYPHADPMKWTIAIPPRFESIEISPEKQEPGKSIKVRAKIPERDKGEMSVNAIYASENDLNAGFGLQYQLEYDAENESYITEIEISENSKPQKYILNITAKSPEITDKIAEGKVTFTVSSPPTPLIISSFTSQSKPGENFLVVAVIENFTERTNVTARSKIFGNEINLTQLHDVQSITAIIPEDFRGYLSNLDVNQAVFTFSTKLLDNLAAGVYELNINASNGVDENIVHAEPRTVSFGVIPIILSVSLDYTDKRIFVSAKVPATETELITVKCLFDNSEVKNANFEEEYTFHYDDEIHQYKTAIHISKKIKPDDYSAQVIAFLADEASSSDSKQIYFRVNKKPFFIVRFIKRIFGKKFKRVEII